MTKFTGAGRPRQAAAQRMSGLKDSLEVAAQAGGGRVAQVDAGGSPTKVAALERRLEVIESGGQTLERSIGSLWRCHGFVILAICRWFA